MKQKIKRLRQKIGVWLIEKALNVFSNPPDGWVMHQEDYDAIKALQNMKARLNGIDP